MRARMDGPKVRELRGELPAAELAKEAGITPETLRRAERGEPVRPDTARGIAGALDVDARTIARAISRRQPA